MRAGPKPRPRWSPELTAGGQPRCPDHLDHVAKKEWRRLAKPLFESGILTVADRAAFAAYCQAYSHWVEAEEKLREGPKLIKTPSGYVQQSPWISIRNKQMEMMGRFMAELGLTPTARVRLADVIEQQPPEKLTLIKIVGVSPKDRDRDDLLVDGSVVLPDNGRC